MGDRILVGIMGAQDIVFSGIRALLSAEPDIEISEAYPAFGATPDVIVYDSVAIEADDGAELSAVIRDLGSVVLVMGRDLRPDLAARALAHGAAGVFSVEADGPTIRALVRSAARGQMEQDDTAARASALGADVGLTKRETQVLAEITRGLRNDEISQQLSLSGNTVKSYIRSAYRKIGVDSRSQAVAWCLTHGFDPPQAH